MQVSGILVNLSTLYDGKWRFQMREENPNKGNPNMQGSGMRFPNQDHKKARKKSPTKILKMQWTTLKRKRTTFSQSHFLFSELFQNNSLSLYRQPNMDLLLIYPLKIADTSVIYHSPFSGGDMIWLVIH